MNSYIPHPDQIAYFREGGRPNKHVRVWDDAQQWCMENPGKMMAIVTPKGTFALTFEALKEAKDTSAE